jgi:hypothetical protein
VKVELAPQDIPRLEVCGRIALRVAMSDGAAEHLPARFKVALSYAMRRPLLDGFHHLHQL